MKVILEGTIDSKYDVKDYYSFSLGRTKVFTLKWVYLPEITISLESKNS